jgi:hypothetical protein
MSLGDKGLRPLLVLHIPPPTSSGQCNCASWASQPASCYTSATTGRGRADNGGGGDQTLAARILQHELLSRVKVNCFWARLITQYTSCITACNKDARVFMKWCCTIPANHWNNPRSCKFSRTRHCMPHTLMQRKVAYSKKIQSSWLPAEMTPNRPDITAVLIYWVLWIPISKSNGCFLDIHKWLSPHTA